MIAAIMLTEREIVEGVDANAPKVKGRIITTLEKAKEIRPLLERCITLAKKGIAAEATSEQFGTSAEPRSEEYKQWRTSEQWRSWANARAPGVAARRKLVSIIRNKEAVEILCSTVAPRFADRNGGYTRILRLAKPRLGDNGTRALLEFVGKNDRVKTKKAQKPEFAAAAPAGESSTSE